MKFLRRGLICFGWMFSMGWTFHSLKPLPGESPWWAVALLLCLIAFPFFYIPWEQERAAAKGEK